MIDLSNLQNKIQAIPQDNTLYLVEKLPCGTGLFVSNGNAIYLVPNEERCVSLSIKTDFLNLETNVFVSAFNSSVPSFENGYYNTIELQMSNYDETEGNLIAFVNLCLAHANYMHGQEFISFFDSLVSLFQLPREQQYKNLIGLVGELALIELIHKDFGLDLSIYWHTEGSSSRLDFVSPFANFEVKTTIGDSLCFTIKHNQLFTNKEKNYLVAVILEESNTGRTLEELITSLLEAPDYCNSMQFAVNVEKEKRRVSPIELHSKRFILKKVYVYRVSDINPFEIIPDCVEDLSYKLDLLPFSYISFAEIFQRNQNLCIK